MRVAYIGNFRAEHSTENHVARALEANGHEVERHQEDAFWSSPSPAVADFVLWTTTYDYGGPKCYPAQLAFLEECRARSTPTIGYHLDLWWGLEREHRIHESPFFRCELVCTADGGHGDEWDKVGVNHAWFPPAVSEAECLPPGRFREEYASDVAFVGSWHGGYHRESRHRHELVEWLQRTYGERCRMWPRPGEPAVRGEALRDLYASAKVLVGDSCMVPHLWRYHSDRIPETLGRGGYLVHPHVAGVTDGALYSAGVHLATWPAGEWELLRRRIDHALRYPERRSKVAMLGRLHVLAHHTYEVRMRQLAALLERRGLGVPA